MMTTLNLRKYSSVLSEMCIVCNEIFRIAPWLAQFIVWVAAAKRKGVMIASTGSLKGKGGIGTY